MQRELYTIGDIRTSRLTRRYARMRGMGATHATFEPPAGLTDQTASTALLNAANDLMLAYMKTGVPSMHAADPYALAFQKEWNLEPAVMATGPSAKLDEDAGYGPNVRDAVAAINGGTAPEVNGAAPTTKPATPAAPPAVAPVPGKAGAATSSKAGVLLLLGGAALVVWLLVRKKRAKSHARAHPMLEVRTNPLRLPRGRHNPAARALR